MSKLIIKHHLVGDIELSEWYAYGSDEWVRDNYGLTESKTQAYSFISVLLQTSGKWTVNFGLYLFKFQHLTEDSYPDAETAKQEADRIIIKASKLMAFL